MWPSGPRHMRRLQCVRDLPLYLRLPDHYRFQSGGDTREMPRRSGSGQRVEGLHKGVGRDRQWRREPLHDGLLSALSIGADRIDLETVARRDDHCLGKRLLMQGSQQRGKLVAFDAQALA
jgi:hypothetical protein